MENSFEYKGLWWTPEDESHQIDGALIFKPGEPVILQLNGELPHILEFKTIILGITSDGKKITLYKCLQTSRESSIPGFTIEKYLIQICIIGYYFRKEEELIFKEIYMNYEYLEEWLGFHVFHHKNEVVEEKIKYIVETKIPDEIIINLADATLKFEYTYHSGIGSYTESVQKIRAWIGVIFNTNTKLENIWKYIQNVSDFLTLGTGKRSTITSPCGCDRY